MCKGSHHVFAIKEGMTPEEMSGLQCECGRMVLELVTCPTCGAVRIKQRAAVRVGLN